MNEQLYMQQSANAGPGELIVSVGLSIVMLIAMWKVFAKAGRPGWAILVPIYNIVVSLEVARLPLWYLLLFFIPVVNLVAWVLVGIATARNFGKGVGFGLGLTFLPFVFYPILAFGSASYDNGPSGWIAPSM